MLPPLLSEKSVNNCLPLLQGGWRYDRRSKKYKYRSLELEGQGGTICLESSAESREYILTYFWGMGTYFYWGDGSIYLLGGWVEIFGG